MNILSFIAKTITKTLGTGNTRNTGDFMRSNPDCPSHVRAAVVLAQGGRPFDPHRPEALRYLHLTNGTF